MKRALRQITWIGAVLIIFSWAFEQLSLRVPIEAFDLLPDVIKDFEFPDVTLDYGESPYNASKVALIIENRPDGKLAPLILHMMSVVPPEWRFRFMGSNESVALVNNSAAIRRQVDVGKLDLTYIPQNMSVGGQEPISQFLTNLWLYEVVLQPAEWLLVFQTDSIMCANSADNLNNWLDYDWIGAPWRTNLRYNGNGGLSLRRVSSIIKVLKHQSRRNKSEPEDVWLTERLAHLPGAKVANGTEALPFSGESIWYEYPMGYHTGGTGKYLAHGLWGKEERRKKIYEYCPEMKMTLFMDTEMHIPKFCHTEW